MSDCLVVFEGIHQTLSAERALKARGEAVTLVPTPPVVSLGCGFSILAQLGADDALPSWWSVLTTRRALYRVILKEGRKDYEEIDRCEGSRLPAAGHQEPRGPDGGGSR